MQQGQGCASQGQGQQVMVYDLLMMMKQSLDEPSGMGWTFVNGTASPGNIHKYNH